MKILKGLLFAVLAIVAIALLAAAVLPKTYSIKESVVINAPKAKIADYFKYLKNTEQYSTWVLDDKSPTVRKYEGIDGSVGAKQIWSGGDMGDGTMTIASVTDDSLGIILEFTTPIPSKDISSYVYEAQDSMHTKVTSNFYGNSKWPFNIMSVLLGKGIISKAERRSLEIAKGILEK
ncbi:MAG: hypothetical protein RL660_883 [Bacteroidota bacterium]|jgi:hypothetical protein